MISRSKSTIFWILQISGWILLTVIYLVIYYRDRLDQFEVTLGLVITHLAGFIVSLLLRHIYKSVKYQSRSIIFLSVLILIGSLIFSQVWYWLDFLMSIPLQGFSQLYNYITFRAYLSTSFSHSFVLLTWSTLYFTINLWIDWNQQRIRTEKANALAHSAQLQMLRYQLNPHFLFNSLNSIRALIDEDWKNAKRMITELSEFLRYSLISKNYSDVPLNDELEAIRHYFAIEKIRYEDKLEVVFDIDPLAEDYPVLSFLIHPVIENAIKYGMKTSPMPLRINISAKVEGGILILEICNSGRWIESSENSSSSKSTGTGLENVRRRLENAFPDNHKFEIHKGDDMVCIKLSIHKKVNKNNEEKI